MNLRTAIRNAVRDAIHDAGIASYPAKDFYFNDFAGIANGTTLRSLDGWAAYSSISATTAERDQWIVQGGRAIRTSVSQDYTTAPGVFVIGRDTGSTSHVIRVKMPSLPDDGGAINIVVGASSQSNCVMMTCVASAGAMVDFFLRKNASGTQATLLTQSGITAQLGRPLLAGDTIELSLLGDRVHLLVNGLRVTPAAGTPTGTFTPGQVCGFGTGARRNTAYDDVYIAELSASVTINTVEDFWPALISSGGRSIPVAGAYTGNVLGLEYRVINPATSATVLDWSPVSSPSISSGAWSASVFVPMCDTTVNPNVRVQVRAANDVDARATSGITCVGIGVGSYGQSNSQFRGQGSATPYAVSNAYTWSQNAESKWRVGSPATERSALWASQIAVATGIPCGVFVFGVGAQTLADLTASGAGYYDEFIAACVASNSYGFVAAWLWTQGEAEAAAYAAFSASSYRAMFDTLLSQLRDGPSASALATVGVCVIGPYRGAHGVSAEFGDANWSAVRECLAGLSDKTGVYTSTNLNDLAMIDNWHYTADAYVESGRRAGLSMKKAMGYGGYDGRGPLITGATRSGAVITLPVDLNGAVSLAGTGLTNYQVSTDDFATFKTISSAAVSGSNIVLTLSADPGAPVKVRSFYGMDYGTPTRAIGTYADGTTIPVEPLFAPITAA